MGQLNRRDGGLEDRGWPRDLILMVLVSEVPVLSAGSRELASRPASGPALDVLVLVSATHVSVLKVSASTTTLLNSM